MSCVSCCCIHTQEDKLKHDDRSIRFFAWNRPGKADPSRSLQHPVSLNTVGRESNIPSVAAAISSDANFFTEIFFFQERTGVKGFHAPPRHVSTLEPTIYNFLLYQGVLFYSRSGTVQCKFSQAFCAPLTVCTCTRTRTGDYRSHVYKYSCSCGTALHLWRTKNEALHEKKISTPLKRSPVLSRHRLPLALRPE